MSRLGIVAALAAESRPLGAVPRGASLAALPGGVWVAVSGVGGTAAARSAERLVEAGATALVSWGMAGALDPALPAGALVLPREVISADGLRLSVAPDWRGQLAAAVAAASAAEHAGMSAGSLLSCREPLLSPLDKAAAFRTTAAVAVDMESVAIAEVAARHRLPFIAVRAIVDTAQDALPPSLASAADAGGALKVGRVIGALLRAPWELAALIRLVPRYRAALRTLGAVAHCGALAPAGPHSVAAPA